MTLTVLAYIGVLVMLGRIGILLERLIERANTANHNSGDELKNLALEVAHLRKQLLRERAEHDESDR